MRHSPHNEAVNVVAAIHVAKLENSGGEKKKKKQGVRNSSLSRLCGL